MNISTFLLPVVLDTFFFCSPPSFAIGPRGQWMDDCVRSMLYFNMNGLVRFMNFWFTKSFLLPSMRWCVWGVHVCEWVPKIPEKKKEHTKRDPLRLITCIYLWYCVKQEGEGRERKFWKL